MLEMLTGTTTAPPEKQVAPPKQEVPLPEKPAVPEKRVAPEQHLSPAEDAAILAEREIEVIEPLIGDRHANQVLVVTLQDDGRGIYKPITGEKEDMRVGIEAGTYYLRESAAFDLDEFLGFGLVPPTVIREAGLSNGAGSIQRFVEGGKSVAETRNKFQEKLVEAPKKEQKEVAKELETINKLLGEKRRERSAYPMNSAEFDLISKEMGTLAAEASKRRQRSDELDTEISGLYRETETKFDEQYREEFMKLWLFDMIVHNADRHGKNLLITDNDRVVAIDNGFAFNGDMVRFFKDYFDVELPDKVVAPLLQLDQRAGWQEEIKKRVGRSLSELEVTNLILRIEKIILFLKQDRRIPKPSKGVREQHQYNDTELNYFPSFLINVPGPSPQPERPLPDDETAPGPDIAMDQTI